MTAGVTSFVGPQMREALVRAAKTALGKQDSAEARRGIYREIARLAGSDAVAELAESERGGPSRSDSEARARVEETIQTLTGLQNKTSGDDVGANG